MFKKIKSRLINEKNTFKSILKLKGFTPIEPIEFFDFEIRGYYISDEIYVAKIYKQLNGIDLSRIHRRLLKKVGVKALFLAVDKTDNRIVAIDMFYFNDRDFRENTIHEGFIGVLPCSEGQGIATCMRKKAIAHFKGNGLSGISTRISKNNFGSLRSAENLGFKVIEEYYDEPNKESRYYMINWFSD
ncbi:MULTISPECIES: GNAT family N-acetyltransferase [Idiomarina]|uniref:GNAT family N-acetyltransferase n=1 Tax=Idiomarina TaxID=135575 RepID=UPI00241CF6DD|nr:MULTISPECIES: GNAT family N-acetyltransferase [Idiomarina]|tara:strand:+ start:18610 stop:19170 length:561 start_codon:yes stop_codon:yes gene_type:complete